MDMNQLAETYVKLVLATGQHNPNYVDAYYGPAQWQAEVKKQPLAELQQKSQQLVRALLPAGGAEDNWRQMFLLKHSQALDFYLAQLAGQNSTFNQESLALYDAVSPDLNESDFAQGLQELSDLLPGTATLNQRLTEYQQAFAIPVERLDKVFAAAIDEARARTKCYLDLPAHENFSVAYVKDKVWSAYNWYKGNAYSLIEVNTDFPMYIARAIDLASHEGYPGHHVFNALLEQDMVRQNGWVEFSIYPLYSPMSLLAEGSANYGIEVVFPHVERLQFERDTLFPLAGLNGAEAERYYQIQAVLQKLSYTGNWVAQRYLDGEIDARQALQDLMRYSLSEQARAEQRLRFIEVHRSYVINYNLGQDLVQHYVDVETGNGGIEKRWQVLTGLLRQPLTASMMQQRIQAKLAS